MAVLYASVAYSTIVLQLFKKDLSFTKNLFQKLKYWKRSKSPVSVTLKHADLLNGVLF